MQKGYKPTYADDLVALCNGTLRTLHVDYAGFPVDLLWASPEDGFGTEGDLDHYTSDVQKPNGQRDRILADLELDPEVWTASVAQLETPIDPEGEQLALERMSCEQWQSLEPRVRHFVSTGLLHLDQQGHAPMLDYAPISLEIVKALEVELGAVFEKFRESVNEASSANADDHAERALESFLDGAKPPTLGAMSYLLRVPRDGASPLALELHQFVSSLSNAEDLTRNKFLKRGLQRVIQKYRNGGVHDSPIPEEVCRECVEVLVGSVDKPGYLSIVAAWKLSPRPYYGAG